MFSTERPLPCAIFTWPRILDKVKSTAVCVWGGHSGPGGRRINLSKCIKNQTKWDIFTLNIAFPKTGKLFNESPQKNDFRPFLHFWPFQVPHWGIGAEKQLPNGQKAKKPKVFHKYLRTRGEGRYDHIEFGPSVCQWIQNINLIWLPEGPNWPTVGAKLPLQIHVCLSSGSLFLKITFLSTFLSNTFLSTFLSNTFFVTFSC